jgi:hypothetical protein
MTIRAHRAHTTAVSVVLALLIAPALAAAPASGPAQGLPPLSAGVSAEDRAPHPEYPLKLIFAVAGGVYLADIQVRVTDAGGAEVLRAHSPGPWLFVHLPAGRYTVRATRPGGEAASTLVNVPTDGQSVSTLIWKDVG